MSRFTIFLAFTMLIVASAMASLVLPSSSLLMEPGPAMDVGAMISVPDKNGSAKGNIYLTSVSIRQATLAQWMVALLDPSVKILPKEETLPQDISPEDYQRIQVQLLEESKTVAKIVALRKLGYDVKLSGEGAQVESILPASPTQGKLQMGDTIIGINGQQLETATQLVDTVTRLTPGDNVTLSVLRDGQKIEVQSSTIESTTEPGHAMLGVLITTRMFGYSLPFDIQIDTQNLAGPSAGLMFTLGIMNALSPGDLTKGYKIAGTGTIAIDGTVGEIDGVKQKVIGAERVGADYFLAPQGNYDDAKAAGKKIKVVSVRTVDDAVQFLSGLEEKKAAVEILPGIQPAARWAPAW